MRRVLLAAGVLLVSSAQAMLPGELDGYKDVKFGMSMAELEARVHGLDCYPGVSPGTTACAGRTGFDLVGVPIKYLIRIAGDRVIGVMLLLEFPEAMDSRARIGKFEELEALLTEKYGKPDNSKKPGSVIADITYRGATWSLEWEGPGRKTYLSLGLRGTKAHDISVSLSYNDLEGARPSLDASEKLRQEQKAKDAEKL